MTALRLARGTLWRAIVERTHAARAAGALAPIETQERLVAQEGLRFSLRRASTLAAKPHAARARPDHDAGNPFLPPDPLLLVGEVTDTHLAVLNKFPVIAHHLLLITRTYVPQTAPLDHADMLAMLACLVEYPALAFYNGGEVAGASQRHKHLQVVPLPLVEDGRRGTRGQATACSPISEQSSPSGYFPSGNLPFERDLVPHGGDGMFRVPAFRFAHAVTKMPRRWTDDIEAAAAEVLKLCRRLLDAADVRDGAYNLLCTSRHMLAVARAQERFRGVSVNSLGFAGSLFAKDEHELAVLAAALPLDVLAAVSRPVAAGIASSQPAH